jgi:hypothetical protein
MGDVENIKRREPVGDIGIYGSVVFNKILKNIQSLVGLCEHDSERLGYLKG